MWSELSTAMPVFAPDCPCIFVGIQPLFRRLLCLMTACSCGDGHHSHVKQLDVCSPLFLCSVYTWLHSKYSFLKQVWESTLTTACVCILSSSFFSLVHPLYDGFKLYGNCWITAWTSGWPPEASTESTTGAQVKAIQLCDQEGWSLAPLLLDPI